LVALLMVGIVTADDAMVADTSNNQTVEGIGIHSGVWNVGRTECFQAPATDCFRLWISFDFNWVKNLFS
ncbi:hypothetical protein HQ531_11665, partial [bacterium]|nr:hypothetical protein [bacterium]